MPLTSNFPPPRIDSTQEGAITGAITEWDDDKGHGWVNYGDKRMFVHARDFKRGQRRPKTGEVIERRA